MIVEWLEYIDRALVVIIHSDDDKWLLDYVMPILREPPFHIPLYIVSAFFLIKYMKWKAFGIIAGALLVVILSDVSSGLLLKPIIHRLRPIHDPYFSHFFRPLVSKGGLYSFPSSHAANHMGLAIYFYLAINRIWNKKWRWLFLWAGLIGYAQIYVGKHFPSDIIVGYLLGGIVASVVFFSLLKTKANSLFELPNSNYSGKSRNELSFNNQL